MSPLFLFLQLALGITTFGCVFNKTHCDCSDIALPGACLGPKSENECFVRACSASSLRCDCTGNSFCKVSNCNYWELESAKPITEYEQGATVTCTQKSKECLQKLWEKHMPAASPGPPEYRMVHFGPQSHHSMMFNMTEFIDKDNFIMKNPNMHGLWRDGLNLRQRYITIRLYKLSDNPKQAILCSVFNTYGLEDNLKEMHVKTMIEIPQGQELDWVACDDPGECVTNQTTGSLFAAHRHESTASDGWCVKPMPADGSGVRVSFTDVEGMRGVVFQSPGGHEREFLFKDGALNGMSGNVDSNGLVSGGKVPQIHINLAGIRVPY